MESRDFNTRVEGDNLFLNNSKMLILDKYFIMHLGPVHQALGWDPAEMLFFIL